MRLKIDLFDFDEFIDLNHLKEVTSPIVFQRGNVPDPFGLLSTDIFGIDVRSRKNKFAYTSLGGHFFHPHVYKSFKRLYRNIERIVNGSEYYRISETGTLVKDEENGETGIEFLYDNWEKINKVLDTDIVDAFSYINDADLSSVAENIYTSKVKGLDGDYQYIGKGDAKARNLIHDFIDESKSIYLRDNFDLHTRKDLREAMDRGFSFDELRDFYQTEVEKFIMSQEPDIKKENIDEER